MRRKYKKQGRIYVGDVEKVKEYCNSRNYQISSVPEMEAMADVTCCRGHNFVRTYEQLHKEILEGRSLCEICGETKRNLMESKSKK